MRHPSSMPRSMLYPLAVLAFALSAAQGQDWPEFRGPTGQGHSAEQDLPLEWNEARNIVWKTPVPGQGWSSPVVAHGRVWLTTATDEEGGTLSLVAFDVATGRQVVNAEVFRRRAGAPINPKNSRASPTPVVDGDRVFVHFGAAGTAALTTSGELVWQKRFSVPNRSMAPEDRPSSTRTSSSSVAMAVIRRSSSRSTRPAGTSAGARSRHPADQAYTTPLVIRVGYRDEIVSVGAYRAAAYRSANRKEIWRVGYPNGFSNVPRPVYGHGLVYVATGFQRPTIMAVGRNGSGDVTKTHVAWTLSRSAPFTPSPILVGDELYVVNDGGIASCLDARTGELHWQQRLGGSFSASPVFAGGRLYFLSEQGVTTVVAPGKTFRSFGQPNPLDGAALASMGVADRSFFIRTDTHLQDGSIHHDRFIWWQANPDGPLPEDIRTAWLYDDATTGTNARASHSQTTPPTLPPRRLGELSHHQTFVKFVSKLHHRRCSRVPSCRRTPTVRKACVQIGAAPARQARADGCRDRRSTAYRRRYNEARVEPSRSQAAVAIGHRDDTGRLITADPSAARPSRAASVCSSNDRSSAATAHRRRSRRAWSCVLSRRRR